MRVLKIHTVVSLSDSDDNNWNPIEWDRAAEELTWERVRCYVVKASSRHLCEFLDDKKKSH